MSYRPFTRANYPYYLNRLDRLTPGSRRRWGQLTPAGLLAHLVFTFEMGCGLQHVEDDSTWFTRTVVRWVACHLLRRFPRGKVKLDPQFTPAPQGDFAAERARLDQAMEAFLDEVERHSTRTLIHPAFGPITLEYSTRVQGIHMDHHLKQFGL